MRNAFLKKSAIAVVLAAGFAVYSLNSRLHTADEKTKAGAHLDSEQKTSHIGTPSPAKASNSLAAPISANAENATGTGEYDIFKVLIRCIGEIDCATFAGGMMSDSLKNDFRVEISVNYPLLFDYPDKQKIMRCSG